MTNTLHSEHPSILDENTIHSCLRHCRKLKQATPCTPVSMEIQDSERRLRDVKEKRDRERIMESRRVRMKEKQAVAAGSGASGVGEKRKPH